MAMVGDRTDLKQVTIRILDQRNKIVFQCENCKVGEMKARRNKFLRYSNIIWPTQQNAGARKGQMGEFRDIWKHRAQKRNTVILPYRYSMSLSSNAHTRCGVELNMSNKFEIGNNEQV